VRGGLSHARSIGALAIAMACVPSDQAPLPCDIDIRLLTGPELLTGSTRLKAGTATKMALNIISTAVMVRLGKVFGNRMVDVSASNSKLVDRSLRILRDLGGVERDNGLVLLDQADGSVKLALLMASSGLTSSEAMELLQTHDGQLRQALASRGLKLAQS
jgi:N-acetylmuramic acid 6-phosphate etherase